MWKQMKSEIENRWGRSKRERGQDVGKRWHLKTETRKWREGKAERSKEENLGDGIGQLRMTKRNKARK